ncbi:hypothetical protein RFI_31064 [Reticulomyxa filosa]|uniref:Calmodulin n=1 Tax=Reticulomyxa filosa TaxID=46433 RepID=X6LWM9_RETFI|nr:hypothetical protein RFI_31064 [Reticulomyxa filosa]|eukprot:ETO06333.1 hypothetical protein RFI_31064 [Reticulomyxa filosa]
MTSFSPEEIAQFQQIYNASDINGDGVLDKEEAITSLKGLGYKHDALRWALKSADKDGNGLITFEEFLFALSQLKKNHGFSAKEVGLFRQAFDAADKDRNGNLDSNELVSALENLGYRRDSAVTALEIVKCKTFIKKKKKIVVLTLFTYVYMYICII